MKVAQILGIVPLFLLVTTATTSCNLRRKASNSETSSSTDDANTQAEPALPAPSIKPAKPKSAKVVDDLDLNITKRPTKAATPVPTITPDSAEIAYQKFLDEKQAPRPAEEVPPIAAELFTEVANAWDGKRVIKTTDEETVVEGIAWTEWANNYTGALVDFSYIVLSFSQPGSAGSNPDENVFNLQLSFSERRLLVDKGVVQAGLLKDMQRNRVGMAVTLRHSRPKQASELRGLRLPIGDSVGNSLYVPGLSNSSVVVMVPPQPRSSVRGALICPRDYQLWELTSNITVLRPTPFTLTKVGFSPDVILDTHSATGSGAGVAESSLQLSRGLGAVPKGVIYKAGRFPRATLVFNPKIDEVAPLAFSETGITEGLLTQQMTHNSLEHRSVSSVKAAVGVAKVRVGREFTLEVEKKRFSVPPGDCYAIVKTWQVNHSFQKEPLPEQVVEMFSESAS